MAFTNSKLTTYTNLTKNRTNGRAGREIDTITIHCFVGQVTAKRGCDFFATTRNECSSNYVVGYDGSIGLSVEEKNRAWTTGGSRTINGETGSENDYHAVTIEVACEAKYPYEVTEAAYKALVKLVADIAKRNGIKKLIWKNNKNLVGKPDQQNMTVHRWFAAKDCPGKYLFDRMGKIAEEANKINEVPAPAKPAAPTTPAQITSTIKIGSLVKITGSTYYNGQTIPNWVKKQNWYVKSITGDRVVIDKNEKGGNSICSPINVKDIALVKAPASSTSSTKPQTTKPLCVGDIVKIKNGCKVYGQNYKFQSWVYKMKLYVREIRSDSVVVSTLKTGAITGVVAKSDIIR